MGWKTSPNNCVDRIVTSKNSLGVRLPLATDAADGYGMIRDIRTMMKQNLKMLLLTIPGERVMQPDFGVGIITYLFNPFNNSVYSEIESKIKQQVNTYLPAVKISNIAFDSSEQDFNKLFISIAYSIPNINIRDLLEFTI